jgi:hypothetical protein
MTYETTTRSITHTCDEAGSVEMCAMEDELVVSRAGAEQSLTQVREIAAFSSSASTEDKSVVTHNGKASRENDVLELEQDQDREALVEVEHKDETETKRHAGVKELGDVNLSTTAR